MSTKVKKTWQEIVEENYVASKKYPAMKSDGTAYLGKSQMYLTEGAWVDKYHAKMQGIEIDETIKRQVPKSRAGYSTLYKVKSNIPPIKKQGLKPLLKQLQLYSGKKGQGKSDSAKAESILKSIKKDLSAGEKIAINQYLNAFYAVVVATDDNVPLQEVAKAAKVGYAIVTAEAKKGGKKNG